MRKLGRILLLLVLVTLAWACKREEDYVPASAADAEVEGRPVEIFFTVPASEMPSKALGEVDADNPMETLYLAVFGSSGYLKEYVKATPVEILDEKYHYVDLGNVPRDVDQYSFRAVLSIADGRRTIHFIGNGPATIPFGYQSAVMPVLLSENGQRAYWQMKELPRIAAKKSTTTYTDDNGERVIPGDYIDKDNNKITGNTGYVADDATLAYFEHIPMIKNWAKIVVEKQLIDPDTGEDNDPYFEPISYAVVNIPSRGTVAPHSAATGFISGYENKSFVELQDLGYTANLPAGTLFDDSIPSESDFKTKGKNPKVTFLSDANNAVYLYERPVPSDKIPASAVIIYGTYLNPDPAEAEYYGKKYFYKVDLMEGDQYYPIYRNFKYQIRIFKIRSHGHYSPAAAAAAAGSADVSADINTSSLNDISDGQGRLVIHDWMAKTFTDQQVMNQELSAYFITDVRNNVVDMDPNSVTAVALPRPYNAEDIITEVHVHEPIEEDPDPDQIGWRRIHFSTIEPGRSISSQTIRVTGNYTHGGKQFRLYRDIVITIQPIQPMKVHCDNPRVPYLAGSEQSVTVSIPDGLVESMFPLQFRIEADKMTLTPDTSKENNNLPVEEGTSISGSGKRSFHFVYTLSWAQYNALPRDTDEDDFVWRLFTCYFKTNRDESASTVYVENEYFSTENAHDSFINFIDDDYRILEFSSAIPRAEGAPVTMFMQLREDAGYNYPDDFPLIAFDVSGMTPVSESVAYDNTINKYVFHPEDFNVTLDFLTTTIDGDIVITFEAEGYQTRTLRTHTFSNFKFVDAHALKGISGNSNVICGRINRDANKQVLFQYYEDPDATEVPVWVENLTGLVYAKPESSDYPVVGLTNGKNASSSLYRELDFKTPSSASSEQVSFDLCANGYVKEHITANRYQGSFITKNHGYSDLSPEATSFTLAMANDQNCTVTFSSISSVNTTSPAGVMLDAGGTYTIDFEVTGNEEAKLYYVQFQMRNNIKWNSVTQDLFPEDVTVSAGTFSRWGNNKYEFIWNLPPGIRTASITMQAKESCPIVIYDIRVNTCRASLY